MTMRILHYNTHDSGGGAAIAALRLHQALLDAGIGSSMAVSKKQTDLLRIAAAGTQLAALLPARVYPHINRLPMRLYSPPKTAGYCTFSWFPKQQDAGHAALPRDITHLHWVTDFLSPYAIGTVQGPLVWTLHDTWAFTAGCHIVQQCLKYTQSCGACPQLGSKREGDLSRFCFNIKKKSYSKIRATIVTPSKAMQEKARASSLLGNFSIVHIPNGIDTHTFRPIDKKQARALLGLEQNTKILLFGAAGATSDHNKGFDLLRSALAQLAQERDDVLCLIFGASHGDTRDIPFPVHFLGQLHDALSLVLAYSAADVFICPSREENLPNTVLESLSCGTPVVAFSIGGISDMVEQQISGFLAPPYETAALAHGIHTILADASLRERMSHAARTKVLQEFASDLIAQRHITLYETLLAEKA